RAESQSWARGATVASAAEANAPGQAGWAVRGLECLRSLALALWREPVARRRAWVVVAAVLVCAYAAGVLVFVVSTPEVGIRCAFTTVVNNFYPAFLYPEDQDSLQPEDRIVQVGDSPPIENWSQLLRATMLLRDRQPAEH